MKGLGRRLESNMASSDEIDQKTAINRFVSIFSGAFRAFHLYRQNNKTLDEILDNVVARFKMASRGHVLKLGITNHSIVYDGEPIGAKELTRYLALGLRRLGLREIIFRAPLHGRHIFPLLNVLTSNDTPDVMMEKLTPFIDDESEKPITLVPITSKSLLMRLSDEAIQQKLKPLSIPRAEGGCGFIEEIEKARLTNLTDTYTWIAVRIEMADTVLQTFVRNMVDACREGYFPWERFLKVFPLPIPLKESLFEKVVNAPVPRMRKATELGLSFHPVGRRPMGPSSVDWPTQMVAYSKDDVKLRRDLLIFGSQQQGLAEIDLAAGLVKEQGANRQLGLRILVRVLSQLNGTAVQEKAVKMGIGLWVQQDPTESDMPILILYSALRRALAMPQNITLTLFAIRSLTIESEMFVKMSRYLTSLGDTVCATLLQALEAEEDRSMRKKLCLILTDLAREQGTDFLRERLETASPFLLRNIIMILGDVRSPQALEHLTDLISHSQKMIRVEVLHSLGKIGTPDAIKALVNALQRPLSPDEKRIALNQLATRKDRSLLEPLIRLARLETRPSDWRRELLTVIGSYGGPGARMYLESLQKSVSLLSNPVDKEEQVLITRLLDRIPK